MSNSALKLLTASGAKGSATYVDDVFSTFLYEGTDAVGNVVTNGIDLAGEGGLVWLKSRGDAQSHGLFDTERGAGKILQSNATAAELSYTDVSSFNSNGFTAGYYSGWFNSTDYKQCSWTFRKAPGFFDVVTYTGNGTAGRTVSHNLGSVPGMIIVKKTSGSSQWPVYHRSRGIGKELFFNKTDAETSYGDLWSGVTSTNFTISNNNQVNYDGDTYVAYLFAHDAQDFGTGSDEAIIKCGSCASGSAGNNTTVDLGFEPQWLIFKNATKTGTYWWIYDTMRGWTGSLGIASDKYIWANTSGAEGSITNYINVTSTGFVMEGGAFATNSTFIYMAIRRPHKPASEFAATDLFAVDNNTTATSARVPNFVSGFPVDMGLANTVDEVGYTSLSSRLTGKQMYTPARDAEEGDPEYDYSTGFKEGGSSTNADEYGWMWRRAPGFFDVVCYKGTGSAVWHNHSLGVVPEMIICKGRNIAEYWNVFTTGGGTSSRLQLNENNEYVTTNSGQYFPSLPTTTQFRIGQNSEIGGSGYNYVAYLFASLDGISKLGTYTGTGSAQNIDCGFSAGARFVLIKRVDVAGYWMVWDSVRGIVAGNDPYLSLNTTAAHITNTDYIDPLASGFTITSSAPTNNSDYSMNKSSGTYFFYAIA